MSLLTFAAPIKKEDIRSMTIKIGINGFGRIGRLALARGMAPR